MLKIHMRLGKLTFFCQKQHIEAKSLKIGWHLGMALCVQSFTINQGPAKSFFNFIGGALLERPGFEPTPPGLC